ncbi:hypothetical protein SLE2022_329350 [Rubroshorea leprosula]
MWRDSEAFGFLWLKTAPNLDHEIVRVIGILKDYFGFKTLDKFYFRKFDSIVADLERKPHMLMMVAVGIHRTDIDRLTLLLEYTI